MRVVAIELGFYGHLRQPGDEFDVPDDEPKSTWFKPVAKKGKGKAEPEKETGDGSDNGEALV